jgi:hypothetical protein
MRKHTLLLFLFICFAQSHSQNKSNPIQSIERIFNDYIEFLETTDSEMDKKEMENALVLLSKQSSKDDFPVLIDVWMYYDPTDFPTRKLIEPILIKNKSDAIIAIGQRLKNKRESENTETPPYSDLMELKRKLSH